MKPPIYASSKLKEVLLSADLMVLPSRFEGLPLSIIDAMSLGVPVLATDVGAIHEVIDDGVNGHIYSEKDFVNLAETRLQELAQDRRELARMSLAALEKARTFVWSQRVIPLLDMLKSQLRDRTLPPLWPPEGRTENANKSSCTYSR